MSADALPTRDAHLDLPLTGVQLIEASAGTGKTFALTTVVTRLIVEQGLRVGQILTVTFTDAATQELRKRIRERLQLACAVFDVAPEADEAAELTLCRQIINRYLEKATESAEALRLRLQQAALEIDLAAVFTIHGFCTRVLREHALDAGAGFEASTLLTNTKALHAQLAADLWRTHAQQAGSADDLQGLWKTPEALAKDLPALLSPLDVLPPAQRVDIAEEQAQLDVAAAALRQAWYAHGAAFFAALAAAIDTEILNKGQYKQDWLTELRGWFERCAASNTYANALHPKLEKLTVAVLESGTKKDFKGKTPVSPMTHEIDAYLQAHAALAAGVEQRRANLLHALREDARTRMAMLKQQHGVLTYDDLIDGVVAALDDSRGEDADALVRSLRKQYEVALVDEFQDTDVRQWGIFERVFGNVSAAPALFLIGDPKQAIYSFRGGDVHTYLTAAKGAVHAPKLRHNFRSRPSVLRAIAALYQSTETPFVDADIQFIDVEPGGKRADTDYLRDGAAAPALTLWNVQACADKNAKGEPKSWSAVDSRELASHACAAAIHAVLSAARAGRALIESQPVQPGDIAVLVRSHREANKIQLALAKLGIAAVAAGKQSLFATAEAGELHVLLLALLQAGDDGRLRAALATVLLGLDAQAIAGLDADSAAHRGWQQRLMGWRERMQRGGPLALLGDLCAEHGPRLLGLLDGERRLSNYLQLAEILQETQASVLGLHGLVEWLAQAIASADDNDEAQLLRLESDAQRVQIITLHKSKGLEYPLVFLPFVGVGSNAKSPGRRCAVHDDAHGRRLHWNLALPAAQWGTAKETWQKEQQAEDARLLYVGLTRARHALWIAQGNFFANKNTALARLLGKPEALAAVDGIAFDQQPASTELPRLLPESESAVAAARCNTRPIRSDWWVYSFSQLSNSDAGGVATADARIDTYSVATVPVSGGNDEARSEHAPEHDAQREAAFDPRFSGNRFGVALHAAFEHSDFAAWQGWLAGDAAPTAQGDVIANALRGEGYGADVLDAGVAFCTQLMGHSLTARLPEGVRLCDLPAEEHRAEIEFQFALQPTQVEALLTLLHAHGVARERDRFGLRTQLEGLMTGLIDLTYRHAGKWYVLDYKSNRLPAYDAAAMQQAMAHSEYDLQALIYSLALHRWLRFRLGDRYCYARDFGGIRYLFCRGIDAASDTDSGIHAACFTPALIAALDALFGYVEEGVAA